MTSVGMLEAALARANRDALWLLDLDGVTLAVNDRACELFGRSREDLLGQHGSLMNDADGVADFARHVELMRAGHLGVDNEEVLVRRPDGSTRWTLCSWSPVPDPDTGEVRSYLHRLTEYTERRALLDSLREREEQLASAQQVAHLGNWTWDLTDDTVWWSDEIYRIYEQDPSTFTVDYTTFLATLHPDDRDRIEQVVLHALGHDDAFEWEGRIVTGTRRVRWVRGAGQIRRDDTGTAVRVLGTSQDITDLRNLDDAASEATRRLQLLQGVAEAANRSLTLRDALIRTSEAIGEHSAWRPVCAWVRRDTSSELFALQLPDVSPDLPAPDPTRAEWVWQHREIDAHPLPGRPAESLVSLPVSHGRGLSCVIQVWADVPYPEPVQMELLRHICDQLNRVAEREQAARELAAVRDEAMAASRHKSDFLATMSHEIRTPMNGVIGLTDLLLDTDLNEDQRRLAEGLRRSGLTLLTLINDILDLSKIESGRLDLEEVTFDVRALLDDTGLVLAGPAQEKGIELVMSCDPEVPRSLVGDPVRLAQVIANLGSNAVKFTEQGQVVIDAGAIREGDRVELRVTVSDTGIGIAPDAVDGLFEAFTQADRSTTRSHGGTGLGLAICRQLVSLMGGEIDFHSQPGDTQFSFTASLGVARIQADDGKAARVTHRRALVVDDNEAAATAVVRILSSWGVHTEIETVPEETVARLAGNLGTDDAFDLAVIDRRMPGVDGLALGAQIREDARLDDVDLVLLAADAVEPDDVVAAGFRGWATKPVREGDLFDALSETNLLNPGSQRDRAPRELGLDVLVVEDNAVNQIVATGLLENLGCRVTVAPHGLAAVSALSPGHPYDLVLMDCRMPLMDGYAATRTIRTRERGRRTPIIAMTASAMPGERDRCLAAGMDDFLTKPVDPAQLAAAVTRWSGTEVTAKVSPSSNGGRANGSTNGSTRAPADTPLVLDPERVEVLSELVKDGVSFFERTRMSFLSRIDTTMAQIVAAVQAGDREEVIATAHALKGSATNLGLNAVGAAAARLEERARAAEPFDDLLPGLREAVDAGVEALATVGHPS